MMDKVKSVVAIFGATGGLGEAVAERVAKGSAVMLGYYNGKAKCEQIVERLKASGT